jgi:hypothetical protein
MQQLLGTCRSKPDELAPPTAMSGGLKSGFTRRVSNCDFRFLQSEIGNAMATA